jgi:hypothetical protein
MKKMIKKRVIILVAIAIVLAIIATYALLSGSNEISTHEQIDTEKTETGRVGVTILPPNVDDKLAENSQEEIG